ncbi:MAG: prepilin peptidase [Opitutae bacterium]|nr:prepilin peptidase [Opitutae bacterium]
MISAYSEVAAQLPWFFPTAAFIFGAIIGSFLNVCIYRIPAGKSIVRPGSHCACGQPIAWYNNIPILSWLILRGRARCCGQKFSIRYPAVELLTALLFLACWLLFPPAKAVCGMVLMGALVCATFIDLDHMIIPDAFTIGLGVVGVVLAVCAPSLHDQHSGIFMVDSLRSGVAAMQGLFVGSGLVLWIALLAEVALKKEAMGFGDVKLVGAIGAFTGWQGAVTAVFGGAIVGTVWFVVALGWRKCAGKNAPAAMKAETPEGEPAELGFGVQVPYGPMLAIAGALHFLWLHRGVAQYFDGLRLVLGD